MSLLEKISDELGRITRYGLVGIVAALTYAGVTFSIGEVGVAGPVIASIVGYCCAATVSYFGHLHYSFGVDPDHRTFLWRFAITVVVTFATTIGCTWLITGYWSYTPGAAVVVVMLLIPATNYICGRFWVFLPRPRV